MGLVRLRIREFAAREGWTLKEVSAPSGVQSKPMQSLEVCQWLTWLH
jgi:hypothetical protein